jgi:CubicO group peptidase (beta-lactamase class C family)
MMREVQDKGPASIFFAGFCYCFVWSRDQMFLTVLIDNNKDLDHEGSTMNINTFRRNALLLVLAVFTATSIHAQNFRESRPARLGLDSERLANLDGILQSYIDNEQVAGSVTLILRDGRIAYTSAKGMQDREAGIAMEPDSIFRIASQTKAIISVGIMILHERGDLLISDPLSKYLPEWENAQVGVPNDQGGLDLEPVDQQITLRHLLTHTSGIGYGGFTNPREHPVNQVWLDAGFRGWYLASRLEPIRETVRTMASLPLMAQPGEEWIYGYNIDILGAVIEVASGQPLDEFLDEAIFTPLGMDDTHFYLPPEKSNRLSRVYLGVGNPEGGLEAAPEEGNMQGQGEYVTGPRTNFSGGAGLLSTASDYAKFLQMTLNGGQLNGERILSPKTVQLMTVDHLNGIPFQTGSGFGLGFGVLQDLGARGTLGSVGEYRWGGAYHSTYWVDPQENLVVVYMTQLRSPNPGLDDYDKLRAGIYSAIIESY